jgi:hypothetical protein
LGGASNRGAFGINRGGIYHMDQAHPVGKAAQNALGQLELRFWGHRKLRGEAVAAKVGNGRWSGPIVFPNGAGRLQLDLERVK